VDGDVFEREARPGEKRKVGAVKFDLAAERGFKRAMNTPAETRRVNEGRDEPREQDGGETSEHNPDKAATVARFGLNCQFLWNREAPLQRIRRARSGFGDEQTCPDYSVETRINGCADNHFEV
jgi:hypothetical protein